MCNFDKIPVELRNIPQWVVTNGSKIPVNPNDLSKQAQVNDPATWGTFKEVKMLHDIGLCDNVGFVFHNNGLVGIDVDDCIKDGKINEEAQAIIDELQSYTEISKSGKGIHIIVESDLPFEGKNNLKGVEIYRTKRYFILTGRIVGGHNAIKTKNIHNILVEKFGNTTQYQREAIYNPIYNKPVGSKISLNCKFPQIPQGSRNISLLSLAGQLRTVGTNRTELIKQLMKCNREACDPPLGMREIEQIVTSVMRYNK